MLYTSTARSSPFLHAPRKRDVLQRTFPISNRRSLSSWTGHSITESRSPCSWRQWDWLWPHKIHPLAPAATPHRSRSDLSGSTTYLVMKAASASMSPMSAGAPRRRFGPSGTPSRAATCAHQHNRSRSFQAPHSPVSSFRPTIEGLACSAGPHSAESRIGARGRLGGFRSSSVGWVCDSALTRPPVAI